MTRRTLLSLVTIFFLLAARHRAIQHPSAPGLNEPLRDVFSFSDPHNVVVRDVALDLTVDFDARRLRGSATLAIDNLRGAHTLVLDTESLTITRVVRDGGIAAAFSVGKSGNFGAPLAIDIEPATRSVTIDYITSPDASGLNWNSAAQSYGRVKPYLYSLNEPVGARSWIPIQDTPAVRVTYAATIRVPAGSLALMSAPDNVRAANGSGVYTFTMNQTLPAYLIALAVGRLEYHAFDERTGVYAEPVLLADAAWELQYMPEMLRAAERILGPHPFPRHDLLLMPPTYIVGGMEHPMLNFIHPFSVVSGNHPAAPEPKTLLAHELAHSWAGDQTTLSTWDDVWLNEGITSYLTLRILEEMAAAERAELAFFLDRRNYENVVRTARDPNTTILHYRPRFPWNAFSSTAYTKGELFVRTLEDVLGRASLDAFLRDYFADFSFRWVDDRNFVAKLREHAGEPALTTARVSEWIYSAGLPSNVLAPTARSTMYDRVLARVNAFANGGSLNAQSWTEAETDLFLQLLPASTFRARISTIDAALGLSFRQTAPFAFLLNSIHAGYTPANAAIERALMRGGPNSWIPSLYAALASTSSGRQRANEIFSRARDRYHPGIAAAVEEILAQAAAAANAA